MIVYNKFWILALSIITILSFWIVICKAYYHRNNSINFDRFKAKSISPLSRNTRYEKVQTKYLNSFAKSKHSLEDIARSRIQRDILKYWKSVSKVINQIFLIKNTFKLLWRSITWEVSLIFYCPGITKNEE